MQFGFPFLMDPRGLRLTKMEYFSLFTHTKQLLLMTFCHTSAGIEVNVRTQGRTEGTMDGRNHGQTDVEVEIFI